jgi:CHAT domain-containing protein
MSAASLVYESKDMKRPELGHRRRRLVWLLSLSIIAICAFGIWYWQSRSPGERATRALVEAYSKRRLIEPRLSGGFHAAVYDSNANDKTNIDLEKLKEAEKYLQDEQSYNNDTKHALGRMLLASRDSNKAIIALRPLSADKSASAEIDNDFGVCQFVQGRTVEALDAFNRALEKKPAMSEALFNRALCYNELQLWDAARDDLIRLQATEEDDGWAVEIRRRLDEVSRPIQPPEKPGKIIKSFNKAIANGRMDEAREIASRNPDKLREHGLGQVVKDYTQAIRASDTTRTRREKAKLELIGKLLAETKGDREMADFAHFIGKLPMKERAANLDLIEQCAKEIDIYHDPKYVKDTTVREEIRKEFVRLQGEFERRGNAVFQVISAWMIAKIHYYFARYKESVDSLKATLLLVQQRRWLYQHSRVMSHMGISYSRLGQDSLAMKYCKQSLEDLRKVGVLEAKALQNVSLPYWHMGDYDTSLKFLRESNVLFFAKDREPAELANNYLLAADIYRVRDRHDISLLFAKQALAFAEKSNEKPFASQDASIYLSKRYAAQATSLMAIEQAQLKQFDEANKNMEQAFEYLSQMDSAPARAYNTPMILSRAGEVAVRQGDITRALELYSEAETLVADAQENKIPMIRVLRGRIDALVAFERFDEASTNLVKAIDLIEFCRSKLISGEERSYFLDAAHALFDQAIVLHMNTHSGQGDAFNLSEQARARTLLEEVSTSDEKPEKIETGLNGSESDPERSNDRGKPLELAAIMEALPENQAVLQYAVTSQGTYLFLVTRSGIEVARSDATTEMLDSLVSKYLSELRSTYTSDDSAALDYLKEIGHELYRELISPIKAKFGNIESFCIVPDKSLNFLPFPALVDDEGKYLIHSYQFSYAPSSSMLVQSIKKQIEKPVKAAEKVVSIGNPSYDPKEFPELKDLPDAATEATEIAGLYGARKGLILTDREATKKRILNELKDCDVGHLALHCLVKDNSPWRAALVVAPTGNASSKTDQNGQSDSLLTLEEMYHEEFKRMRLAVLSACESGLGQYHRGEGIVSLARPFIASGVPTVVASLWSVESRATRELMIEFHKESIKLKGCPGEALQTAQIKMASSSYYQHPYYWAAFIVIGGSN